MKILAHLLDTKISIGVVTLGPLISVTTPTKHLVEVILRIAGYLAFNALFRWTWKTRIVGYSCGDGPENCHVMLFGVDWFDYGLGVVVWGLLLFLSYWLVSFFANVLKLHKATCWVLMAPLIYLSILASGYLMRPQFRY